MRSLPGSIRLISGCSFLQLCHGSPPTRRPHTTATKPERGPHRFARRRMHWVQSSLTCICTETLVRAANIGAFGPTDWEDTEATLGRGIMRTHGPDTTFEFVPETRQVILALRVRRMRLSPYTGNTLPRSTSGSNHAKRISNPACYTTVHQRSKADRYAG